MTSDNAFTGSFPFQFFSAPSLKILAMVTNCFDGTLSSDICKVKSAEILALDGLSLGNKCTTNKVNSFFSAKFSGSLPRCLFEMPNLQSLHLSGNGLTGEVYNIPNDSKFISLVLSHNQLSGTIPTSIQTQPFEVLDLSNNQIKGSCADFKVSNSRKQLSLSLNRLSGEIPFAFTTVPQIDVLQGNLFQCLEHIPTNDPKVKGVETNVVCGSGDMNTALYVTSSIWVVISICVYELFRRSKLVNLDDKNPQFVLLKSFRKIKNSASVIETKYFSKLLGKLCRFGKWMSLCTCLIYIPLYPLLKSSPLGEFDGSTHSYQYAWVISAAYLGGVYPSIIIFLFWCFLMALFLFFFASIEQWRIQERTRGMLSNTAYMSTPAIGANVSVPIVIVKLIAIVLTNVIVCSLIYVFYLYLDKQNMTLTELFFLQVAVACLKLLWNGVIIGVVSRFFYENELKWSLHVMSVMLILNNTILFFSVIFYYSPVCFMYLFTNPPTVTASYVIYTCSHWNPYHDTLATSYTVLCGGYQSVLTTSSFVPPYYYGHQCTSAAITKFLPILLYSSIISLLFSVMIQIKVILDADKPANSKIALPLFFKKYVPPLVWISYGMATQDRFKTNSVSDETADDDKADTSELVGVGDDTEKENDFKLFCSDLVYAKFIENIILMFTWGILFPYLTILVTFSMYIDKLNWRTTVSCYLDYMTKAKKKSIALEQLRLSSKDISHVAFLNVWKPAALISTILFGVLLFDIAGDDPSQKGKYSYVFLICCLVYIILLHIARIFCKKYIRNMVLLTNIRDSVFAITQLRMFSPDIAEPATDVL